MRLALLLIVPIVAAGFAVDQFVTPDKLPSVNKKLEPIPDNGASPTPLPSPALSGCKPGCTCNRTGCTCGEIIAGKPCANIVAQAGDPVKQEVLAVYAPPYCVVPCKWLKDHLGEGDSKTKLDWRKREAWFKPKSYPLVINMRTLKYWCQDPEKPDTRPKTMDELRAILEAKPQQVSKGVPVQ